MGQQDWYKPYPMQENPVQPCIRIYFNLGHFNPQWDVADSVAGGSCWQRAFATEKASEVEFICKQNGVRYEWVHSYENDANPTLITYKQLSW